MLAFCARSDSNGIEPLLSDKSIACSELAFTPLSLLPQICGNAKEENIFSGVIPFCHFLLWHAFSVTKATSERSKINVESSPVRALSLWSLACAAASGISLIFSLSLTCKGVTENAFLSNYKLDKWKE